VEAMKSGKDFEGRHEPQEVHAGSSARLLVAILIIFLKEQLDCLLQPAAQIGRSPDTHEVALVADDID
jgi:hypothetical protein